jgi:hypothetical protein
MVEAPMAHLFEYWNHLIGRGCEDDHPSRDAHGAEVKKYAEMLICRPS